jgi:hypothetical protein
MWHALVATTTPAIGAGTGTGADDGHLGQAPPMTAPEPDDPQPRDIALEQETPELAADLEAQSEPEAEES